MCMGVFWWGGGQMRELELGKCELAGMWLANQEGCSSLDLWFSSGLGEVNFQLVNRRAGAQAPYNNLMAVDTACFM